MAGALKYSSRALLSASPSRLAPGFTSAGRRVHIAAPKNFRYGRTPQGRDLDRTVRRSKSGNAPIEVRCHLHGALELSERWPVRG
jgi:hypothetical protein